jgi:glutaredoxin
MTTTLTITLYTKPGCHLCEQAVAELDRLRWRHPHTLEQINIAADEELMRRYGDRIPVVVLNGREYEAPLPGAVLERALAEAHAT